MVRLLRRFQLKENPQDRIFWMASDMENDMGNSQETKFSHDGSMVLVEKC